MERMMMRRQWIGRILALALLLSGCRAVEGLIGGVETPSPVPTAATAPSAVTPSPAVVPSPDPTPSHSPLLTPGPSPTPSPSPSPTPAPSPSSTPAPTQTPKPISAGGTYRIIIDESTQILSVMGRDESGAYTALIRQMLCSTGSQKGKVPYGTYQISARYSWLSSDKYNCYARYACRFYGVYFIHSVTYERKDIHSLIRQSYLDLGKAVSAGCIRLTVRDAKWIYDNCSNGTVVEYRASGGPPATALLPIPALEDWMNFDPTDPDCSGVTPAPTEEPVTDPPNDGP